MVWCLFCTFYCFFAYQIEQAFIWIKQKFNIFLEGHWVRVTKNTSFLSNSILFGSDYTRCTPVNHCISRVKKPVSLYSLSLYLLHPGAPHEYLSRYFTQQKQSLTFLRSFSPSWTTLMWLVRFCHKFMSLSLVHHTKKLASACATSAFCVFVRRLCLFY